MDECEIDDKLVIDPQGYETGPKSVASSQDQSIASSSSTQDYDMIVCDMLVKDEQYLSVKRKNCYQYDLSE